VSLIRYCVGECGKGTKSQTFAHSKEPHTQEAGIAACSPPSKYITFHQFNIDTYRRDEGERVGVGG
jgi:hypothetical protein